LVNARPPSFKTNKMRSSEQNHNCEGEIARAKVTAASK
jgi:hypothetical protein